MLYGFTGYNESRNGGPLGPLMKRLFPWIIAPGSQTGGEVGVEEAQLAMCLLAFANAVGLSIGFA